MAALALACVASLWNWFVTDGMPPRDFPGYVAQIQYVRDALLRHGHVPIWCGGCFGGTTHFTGHLKEYLAFPLAVWVEPVLATKLLFAILKVLAALGLYAVVVRLFRAPLAGLIAGYAYGFGAFANHQREHLDVALALVLLPLIFLASVELLRRGRVVWALGLGTLSACQLVNNWVHAVPVPIVLAVLLLLRPWHAPGGAADPRQRGLAPRWAGLAAVAFGVFLALAASQLVWIASDAGNHRLLPEESAARKREIYIERSPFLFVNRDDVLGPWLEAHHPPGLEGVIGDGGRRYLGIVALAVCVVGCVVARRDPRLRRWAGVAALMLLFQYWLSLGPRTLLWEFAGSLHWGPEAEGAWRTGLRVSSAACLVAAGAWALWRRGSRSAWMAGGPLVGTALLLGFPTFSLWDLAARALPILEVQRSPGHYFDTASFWLYLLLAVALVAIQRRISRPWAARALLATVALAMALDFWPSRRGFGLGIPMPPLRAAAGMLENLPSSGPTTRLATTPAYSPLSSWLVAQAPTGHAWGWLHWQAGRHWADFMESAAWAPLRGGVGTPPTASTPLLAAGRIRYFLLDALSDGLQRLPAPWQLRGVRGRFSIWEQPGVSPPALGYRSYVLLDDAPEGDVSGVGGSRARSTRVSRSLRENVLPVWAAGALDPGSDLPVSAAAPAAPFEVAYQRSEPERIRLFVEAGPEPAMIFVSEGYHPWWRATVDGRRVPVLRAALAFLAVPVGPGSHRVELRLEPPLSVVCADGLSRAGWLVLALGASAAALLRWRRRRSGPPC